MASRWGSRARRALSSSLGLFFRISTVLTLMGGTMFLMWLGEQITSRGIGNGSSLIIFAGIVAAFPSAIVNTLELGRQGAISTGLIIGVMAMSIAVVAFIVFMERAQRRLLITYPKRQQGNKIYEGQTSFLPLKLNTFGRHPADFCVLAFAAARHDRQFLAESGRHRNSRDDHDLSRSRPPALYGRLCRADRLFRLFLYRHRLQSRRRRRTISRNTAASCPGYGRANARRNISIRS